MRKTKFFTISIFIIIGVITILGVNFYDNQWYAIRLIDAIQKDDIAKIEQLLKSATGNVDAKRFTFDVIAKFSESNNATPLYEACIEGNLQAVKLLVDAGANVNVVEPITKGTPLSGALGNVNENRIEIANYLIDRGANVKEELFSIFWSSCLNNDGTKNIAKEKAEYELFLRMINNGAEIWNKSKDGNSILHISASVDNLLVMNYLIENYNIDINLPNDVDRTALFFCNSIDTAKYLLKHGADKNRKDNNGKSAYEYALENGNKEIAELLKD